MNQPDRIDKQAFMSANARPTVVSADIIPLDQPNRPRLTPIGHSARPTAKTTALPTEHFKYRGRSWRLFKRAGSPYWQLEFQHEGKRIPYSLKTDSKQHAIAEAKLKIEVYFNRRSDQLRGGTRTTKLAALRDVFAIVPHLPIDATSKTRESYVWSLRWVLRLALGLADDAQVNALSASVLSDDTARLFFERVTAQAASLGPVAGEMFKRNAIAFYDNARALFAPRALRAMRKNFTLSLPDLTDFRAGKLHAPKTAAPARVPPPQLAERRALIEWVRLARTPGYFIPTCDGESHGHPLSETDRRNMFVAVGLALSFGFRKGDIVRAQWDWFGRDENGPLCLANRVTQKNRQTVIDISAVDPFWRVLNFWLDKNGWCGKPGATCLIARSKTKGDHGELQFSHGGECDRTYWPFWLVGKWLRWLGWDTQKTNHALRDLVASKLTMKYGLDAAKTWARHQQQATTETNYNRFKRRSEQMDKRKLAWIRWAK